MSDDPETTTQEAAWNEYVDAAIEAHQKITLDLAGFIGGLASQISKYGNDNKVPLDVMTCALSAIFASMAMMAADNNATDSCTIDSYLLFAEAAIHVETGYVRLIHGFSTPSVTIN